MLFFNLYLQLHLQVCPVDLTRSVPTTTSSAASATSSEKENKRLAFSVENILDPNKFTGKTTPAGLYKWNCNGSNYDRDEDMHERLDEEQSEDMSGKPQNFY